MVDSNSCQEGCVRDWTAGRNRKKWVGWTASHVQECGIQWQNF